MEKPADCYEKVMRTAYNILSYGDNTVSRLRRKLTDKGYTEDECDYALRYLVENHLLDEEKQLYTAIRRLADGKLYGKRRILTELMHLGFSREVLRAAQDNDCFAEIDFAANCEKLLRRRGGVADDRNMAYLMRYGYTYSEIRVAAQNCMDVKES